jgi:copper chaperone CopZ
MADLVLYVPSMSCQACKTTLEKAIRQVGGIRRIDIQVDPRTIMVDFEGQPRIAEVIEAVEKTHPVAVHTGG